MTSRLLACLSIVGALAASSAHAQNATAAPPGASGPAAAPAAAPEPTAEPPADAAAAEAKPSPKDEEEARAHFRMGVDFYRERNFRAALIEFQRAYRAAPHYKLLYNLGQASVELQEYAPAIDYLTGYLRAGRDEIDDARKKEVEQTILELEERIATVTIECEQGANIFVDDTLVGRAPLDRLVRVGAGRRKFAAQKDTGQRTERVLDVAAGDHLTVALTFDERSEEPLAAAPAALDEPEEPRRSSSPAIPWAIAATAVLAAGAGTTAVLTALAQKDYKDEVRRETTKSSLDRLRDDAKTKALITDVLLSATLASAIVTTVLILTDDSVPEGAADAGARVSVALTPAGVSVHGRL